jgi:hypothetical protein
MRLKRYDDGASPGRSRTFDCPADHFLVTTMDSVKNPDGQMQRARERSQLFDTT